MTNAALFLVVLIWVSFCFAEVEIAIEGPHGWAVNLPTWRLPDDHWLTVLLGRPVTGYHVWMIVFVFSILHVPLVFTRPTWSMELQILSFNILFWVLEDFLWFVRNPAFGFANFKAEKIWWHKVWWGVMPRDYYVGTFAGTALYAFSLT